MVTPEALKSAIEDCRSLLTEAAKKASKRGQIFSVLETLSIKVLQTILSAYEESPSKIVSFGAAMAGRHIDALLQLDTKLGRRNNPAHRRLRELYQKVGSRLADEGEAYNPLDLKHLAESTRAKFDEQPVEKLNEIKASRARVYMRCTTQGALLYISP
jgi:hypothetical protein